MAEYLSPGVYVEEFDSGIKAMEGVGTSTAGFVGMAQKGPVRGLPVLITSMADYQRRFGGYLPERTYGKKRFLPYAVEQFFNNGGSSCYVMRVCEKGKEGQYLSTVAEGGISEIEKDPFLKLTASDPGAWGNNIRARFTLLTKSRTSVKDITEDQSENGPYTVTCGLEDASALQEEDMVCLQKAEKNSPFFFGVVQKIDGDKVTLKCVKTEAAKLKAASEQPEAPDTENPQPEQPEAPDTENPQPEQPETPDMENPQPQKPAKKDGTSPEVFLYLAEWGLTIQDDTASEQYESVSFNPDRSNYADNALEKSQIVTVKTDPANLAAGMIDDLLGKEEETAIVVSLAGGSDGDISQKIDASMYEGNDGAPDMRTGLTAFKTLSDVSIMAIPGITDPAVQSALVSHCENMGNRFAILDMPLEYKEVSDLQEFRENVDTSYAAMYHPWLQCYDSLTRRNTYLPPSGAMAGIYGRTDNTRGVHKAPANETVRNCTGLSVNYNEAEQGKLNPKGINLIRALPGQGIRVWGARTCSSDGNWKYVNVRRLFIFIEESIRTNTNWAVFEPNDEMLWSRVEGTIRVFLTTQWRNGALAGSTADEAFFINIGKSTMTEDDILNGRLICVIGVAPVRPAEFVIFRITQKMETAQ
ncbi:MAG: phage tail sheath subtilisin-like domain-containing protein [Eubacterium sp.]|nr:phage tail sheath subtilisin-like domain-containing protein [Eubacterium sp.]